MNLYCCAACGRALFPARLLCPDCGASAWDIVACATGRVEATTVLRRDGEDIHLASVRTPPGVIVLARLEHTALAGTVTLHDRPDGAVIARETNGDPSP